MLACFLGLLALQHGLDTDGYNAHDTHSLCERLMSVVSRLPAHGKDYRGSNCNGLKATLLAKVSYTRVSCWQTCLLAIVLGTPCRSAVAGLMRVHEKLPVALVTVAEALALHLDVAEPMQAVVQQCWLWLADVLTAAAKAVLQQQVTNSIPAHRCFQPLTKGGIVSSREIYCVTSYA